MRNFVRRSFEILMARSPVRRVLISGMAHKTVILAYHNVVPDGMADPGSGGLHIGLSRFGSHLDLLQRHFEIIPLSQVLRPGAGRVRAVLTFDDAYLGTLRCALPELERRGLPSTVFVPTALMGGPPFWWDLLSVSGWEGAQIPLQELRGDRDAVLRWAEEAGVSLRVPPALLHPGEVQDLLEFKDSTLVRFGVHSESHRNLARLEAKDVALELADSRARIQEWGLPYSNWVAWPYGLFDEGCLAECQRLGFDGALRISGAAFGNDPEHMFRLPRVNVPSGATAENLLLRCAGVLPGR